MAAVCRASQWWDNGRSKPTSRYAKLRHNYSKVILWLDNGQKLDWVYSQLATWGAGMKGPPDFICTVIQRQRAFGTVAVHKDHLHAAVCGKLYEGDGAVDSLNLLVQRRCHVPKDLFYRVLKNCIANKDLHLGIRIHALTVQAGYEGDAFLATHLIGMYASHGRLEEAMRVFTKLSIPDVYNWATIIFAYAKHGKAAQAIRLYRQMRESTIKPDSHIHVAVLKACATVRDLVSGKEVHAHILASHGNSSHFLQIGVVDKLGGSLVNMYAKCGSLEDARSVFDRLPEKNVVTWNAMLAGYAQHGLGQEAISLYSRMQNEGLHRPNSVTFICLLQACASVGVGALHQGKQFHAHIADQGLEGDVVLGGSLVNMYAKCGSLEDARSVFDRLPARNVVTWTAMIAGYAQQEMGQEALGLFKSMQQEGVDPPNSVTFVCLLQACASVGVGALRQGEEIHALVAERGLESNVVLGGCLVNMYAKCGSLENARVIFDRLPDRDVVTWTTMIAGYAEQGMGQEAFNLYSTMRQKGLNPPTTVTFVCLLQACASVGVGALHQGKQLHAEIAEQGLETDLVLGGSLVNMYAKCGCLQDARRLFDRLPMRNVVSWTAMIAGYAQQEMGQEALSLFCSMEQEDLNPLDCVAFVCLLQACASVGAGALQQGKQLHAQIAEQGLELDVVVGGSLVNMYARCGSMEDAHRVFDKLPARNVVTWTAMIAGYAEQGMGQEALTLYTIMQKEGLSPPDSVTFVCLLQACAIVAALPVGKQLHAQIGERGLQSDLVVGAALVNMYAKCGSMPDSLLVFDALPERNIEAWGALIAGYTRQGDCEVVFALLDRMKVEGMQPNGITFLSVLTMCSHVGLVDKGRQSFEAMTHHGISPTREHYICMIDLLGRAGHLDEALRMAKSMPFQPDSTVWRTLLGACRKWNNVEIGQEAFQFAVSVDGKDAAAYVLMANIYASAEMWEESKELQARRVRSGAWKMPGQSWWTDMGGVVHTFVVGDRKSHE